MKIALVHPKFDRSGGAEQYASALARGLVALGHEVHLFGRRAEGLAPGVAFHPIRCLPWGRALKTWTFARAARRRVEGRTFDVVQGFGKTTVQTVHRTGGGVHRAYLEREGRRRPTPYDRVVLRIEDKLFSSSRLRAVIAPSVWVLREIERFYPAAASLVHVIPNGVDTAVFCPDGRERDRGRLAGRLGLPAAAAVLLFVATNFPLKGLDWALGLLALLPEAHLVVAGGDDQGPFRRQAEALGADGRLHFLGRVDDVGPLYCAADLLVHPTRYDPFANVCLEALASGTPVLTTERNGAADVLSDPRAGAVLEVDAPVEQGAFAARSLLRAGPAGREAARAVALRCDQAQHVRAVEALYRAVAGAPA
ncbi:MAG: glycosyltransferase family 4 protein [Deltaproteobacteria bacterium]|nr:glycosyltransferase family 4 protein [Deltaproteobacteria bacterium]